MKAIGRMRRNRGRSSQGRIGLLAVAVMALLVGCVPEGRDTPSPTPPEPDPPAPTIKHKVQGIAYILEDGQLRSRRELRAEVENEMGTITGMGQYSDREKVTVRAEKKEGPYKLRWLYEQEGKGGFTKEKGIVDVTSNEGEYDKVQDASCEITFQITSDMLFVAIFTKEEEPETPPDPEPNPDDIEDGMVVMEINPLVGGQVKEQWHYTDKIAIHTMRGGELAEKYIYRQMENRWVIEGTEQEEEKNRINKGESYLFVAPNKAITLQDGAAWVQHYTGTLQYAHTTETAGDLQMKEATGGLRLALEGVVEEMIYEVSITYEKNKATRFDLLNELWEEEREEVTEFLTGGALRRPWEADLRYNNGEIVVTIEAKSVSHSYKTTLAIPYAMGQVKEQKVLFNKEIATEIPLTYTDQIEDKSYWKGINQKAWDMIYPNIVQLPTSEVEEMFFRWYPKRGGVLPFMELAQGEANVLAIEIWRRQENWVENRTSDKSKAWRVAFALADMSGEIKEIYPPIWYTTVPGSVRQPCYITLPEGDYQLRVLLNVPERRHQWIDLQMVTSISNWVPYTVSEGYTKEEILEMGRRLNPYGKIDTEPIPLSWGDTSDEMRHFRVVDRRNIPIWSNARVMKPDGEQLIFGGSPNLVGFLAGKAYHLKVDLYNKSSRLMRGRVVVYHQQKHWVTGDMSYAEFRDRETHKMNMERNKKYGIKTWDYVTGLDEFQREMGAIEVSLTPGSNELSIPITKRQSTPYISRSLYYYSMILMYWQPEGSSELIPLTGSFHHALNGMQREGGDWTDWWSYDRIIKDGDNRVVSKFNPAGQHPNEFANGLRAN